MLCELSRLTMDLLSASLAVVTWIGVWKFFAPNNESVYYNPHCISSESVGFHLEDGQGNEIEEPLPWSDYDWREYLDYEADSFIECFVDNWQEFVANEH